MGGIDRRGFLKAVSAVATGVGMGIAPFQSAWAFDRHTRRLAPSRRLKRVWIDAGHGGFDPGCIGCTGIYEKDIVLDTAIDLARRLEASRRFEVFMTRTNDTFVSLDDRVIRARAHDADLFLSVHANALPQPYVRGAQVFTLSQKASDKEAAEVAARENSSGFVAGMDFHSKDPEVNDILFDLTRRLTSNLSIRLANGVVTTMGHQVKLLPNPRRSADFVVLKAPNIPSALVEIGCLSNRQEERELNQLAYRKRIAGALYRSVNDYFDAVANA